MINPRIHSLFLSIEFLNINQCKKKHLLQIQLINPTNVCSTAENQYFDKETKETKLIKNAHNPYHVVLWEVITKIRSNLC